MWIAFHLPLLLAYSLFPMHLTILACCHHVWNHMTFITFLYWTYYINYKNNRMIRPHNIDSIEKSFVFQFQNVLNSIKQESFYWESFLGYFVIVNDLSFTKCVTHKSFTAYLLASLLHSCFGWFGTIWMGALIYRCKKVRHRNLSDKACIETNRALS